MLANVHYRLSWLAELRQSRRRRNTSTMMTRRPAVAATMTADVPGRQSAESRRRHQCARDAPSVAAIVGDDKSSGLMHRNRHVLVHVHRMRHRMRNWHGVRLANDDRLVDDLGRTRTLILDANVVPALRATVHFLINKIF